MVISNLGHPAELTEVSVFAEVTDPFLIFADPGDPIRRDFPLTYNYQPLLNVDLGQVLQAETGWTLITAKKV